ncbi:MAG: hypothetical protein COA52_06770 [Hyphomicrobiales bacterium]|nr:MAG: hypothetical protein COA52_06770 [Hyphomicrobiales bacterium]
MPDFALPAVLFLAFIVVQRLGELALAKKNTKALLLQGAKEYGASHYPLIVALHTFWVLALIILGFNQTVVLPWLALFAVLQVGRIWILASLGPRWTTRIIVLDKPLVKAGPFAFIRHPNYVLVVAEIFVAPMVLGLTTVALAFSVLNAAVLFIRISAEEKALAQLRG